MARLTRLAAASTLAAAFSLAATPAAARGYYHHHHWHHDHVDGGDVLLGAAIVGGIAAIAGAAGRHDHGYDAPPPPPPVPDGRQGYGYAAPVAGQGLDRAADTCAEAVSRGSDRVETIDNLARDRDGWSVVGTLAGGAGFRCRIGHDGQVLGVDLGNQRGEAVAPPPGAYAPAPRGEIDGDLPDSADNRPVWRDQPQAPDDGRYVTSQAADFGQGV